jgi:MFS family permease
MSTLMLGANLVWVSYSTILLPTLIENVVTERKGLVVGLIGFFGTLLAVIVSILWGIISDHTSSKWGKRTPAILTGALAALPLIVLPSLILSPSFRTMILPMALPIIIISYFGMQFFTNMGNGAWWPLLVDVVPENQHGLASGIQGFMMLLGAAIGILAVTGLNQYGQTGSALWMIGGVLALTGIINALVIKGKDRPDSPFQQISIYRAFRDMFKVHTRVAVFFWLVLAILLANMGINSLQFFARYFFEVYFPAISPDAAYRSMGGISLTLTMLAAIGYMLFLIFVGLRAIATGPILATAPALASDLSPKDEAGRYMAYNNLTTGLSGALSALIFGVLLASMTKTTFMYLFILSAVLFLVGGILFSIKVPQKELDAVVKTGSEKVREAA